MQNDKDIGNVMSILRKILAALNPNNQSVNPSTDSGSQVVYCGIQVTASKAPTKTVDEICEVFPSLQEQSTNPMYAHLGTNIHHSTLYDDPFK